MMAEERAVDVCERLAAIRGRGFVSIEVSGIIADAIRAAVAEERAVREGVEKQLRQRLGVLVDTACPECQKRERKAMQRTCR